MDQAVQSIQTAETLAGRFRALASAYSGGRDIEGVGMRIGEANQIYPEIWQHLDRARAVLAGRGGDTAMYDAIRAQEPAFVTGVTGVTAIAETATHYAHKSATTATRARRRPRPRSRRRCPPAAPTPRTRATARISRSTTPCPAAARRSTTATSASRRAGR